MKKILFVLSILMTVGMVANAQSCTKAKKACCKKGAKVAASSSEADVAPVEMAKKGSCSKDGAKKACCKKGAKKACCKKGAKGSCTKNAKTTSVKSSMTEAEIAAQNDENIEVRICEKSGKKSFYRKNVCPNSGKVSYEEVSYCTKSKKFTKVASAEMEADVAPVKMAKKGSCSKDGAKKACCKKGAKKACCKKGAKASSMKK